MTVPKIMTAFISTKVFNFESFHHLCFATTEMLGFAQNADTPRQPALRGGDRERRKAMEGDEGAME